MFSRFDAMHERRGGWTDGRNCCVPAICAPVIKCHYYWARISA